MLVEVQELPPLPTVRQAESKVCVRLTINMCLIVRMAIPIPTYAEAATEPPRQCVLDSNHEAVDTVFAWWRPAKLNALILKF
jgi:hypothetical protein